jgi:hypothetical protein
MIKETNSKTTVILSTANLTNQTPRGVNMLTDSFSIASREKARR